MCTGRDLVARVARTAAICRKPCFLGPTGCMQGCVFSGRSCMRDTQVRRGCTAGVWATTWVRGGAEGRRRTLVGSPCSGAGTLGQCVDGRMGATRCLPPVRGRAWVDDWAGAASGGSFRAVAPVAVWGMSRLLREERVLYGKVPNNAYSQGSQELSASAGAYWPGSLTDAQGPAVAWPPRTLLCAPGWYVPYIERKVALVVKNWPIV
jgi:hypothetical protein